MTSGNTMSRLNPEQLAFFQPQLQQQQQLASIVVNGPDDPQFSVASMQSQHPVQVTDQHQMAAAAPHPQGFPSMLPPHSGVHEPMMNQNHSTHQHLPAAGHVYHQGLTAPPQPQMSVGYPQGNQVPQQQQQQQQMNGFGYPYGNQGPQQQQLQLRDLGNPFIFGEQQDFSSLDSGYPSGGQIIMGPYQMPPKNCSPGVTQAQIVPTMAQALPPHGTAHGQQMATIPQALPPQRVAHHQVVPLPGPLGPSPPESNNWTYITGMRPYRVHKSICTSAPPTARQMAQQLDIAHKFEDEKHLRDAAPAMNFLLGRTGLTREQWLQNRTQELLNMQEEKLTKYVEHWAARDDRKNP